jgi:hypothetical protein
MDNCLPDQMVMQAGNSGSITMIQKLLGAERCRNFFAIKHTLHLNNFVAKENETLG